MLFGNREVFFKGLVTAACALIINKIPAGPKDHFAGPKSGHSGPKSAGFTI